MIDCDASNVAQGGVYLRFRMVKRELFAILVDVSRRQRETTV